MADDGHMAGDPELEDMGLAAQDDAAFPQPEDEAPAPSAFGSAFGFSIANSEEADLSALDTTQEEPSLVQEPIADEIPDLLGGCDDLMLLPGGGDSGAEAGFSMSDLLRQQEQPAAATDDDLLDLMDVSALPKDATSPTGRKRSETAPGEVKPKRKPKSREERGLKKAGKGEKKGRKNSQEPLEQLVPAASSTGVEQGGPPPKQEFGLLETLTIKDAVRQFEPLWTSAMLSKKLTGKLKQKLNEADLCQLLSANRMTTIASGTVNGIVKCYFMGESNKNSIAMVEVMMDPGAMMIDATLKIEDHRQLQHFFNYLQCAISSVMV